MKKLILVVAFLLFCSTVEAYQLEPRGQGTSVHGTYNLIYDADLDITWYDFSDAIATWDNQVAWANALSVNYSGIILEGWRLPTTVDGAYVFSYDGTTTAGYSITNSEMGHLYYSELNNIAGFSSEGGPKQPGSGLINTGDFQNLNPFGVYWSGTEFGDDTLGAWHFSFDGGLQGEGPKDSTFYGLAVRSGNVTNPIPEPSTYILLGIGLIGIAVISIRKKLSMNK